MATGVLCAVRGAGEAMVVRAVDATAGRLSVTRRCADLAELLAAAEAGLGRVAVVSVDLAQLDREAVGALHRCGVSVVGLGDPAAPWLGERLVALGADRVLDAPTDDQEAAVLVREVVAVLATAAEARAPSGRRAAGAAGGPAPGGPAAATPQRETDGRDEDDEDGGRPLPARVAGRVVAVWGPTGAPGRTTVALNLAAELAQLGASTLLVDADTYGGTVAQSVGLLDEAPGLAAAARSAGQGTLDTATLARLAPVLVTNLRVLSGIARADRWPELPAVSLDVVWAVARSLAAWTVVDCGFSLEQDEALRYDTSAPRRNAATVSALESADLVLVVGAGDPVGIQRLVRAHGDLGDLGLRAPVTVVVTKVRASAVGPRPGDAISDALARYAGIRAPHLVPDDRPALDRAMLEGKLLHEVAPASPARRAIAALAAACVTARGQAATAAPVPSAPERAAVPAAARLADG